MNVFKVLIGTLDIHCTENTPRLRYVTRWCLWLWRGGLDGLVCRIGGLTHFPWEWVTDRCNLSRLQVCWSDTLICRLFMVCSSQGGQTLLIFSILCILNFMTMGCRWSKFYVDVCVKKIENTPG